MSVYDDIINGNYNKKKRSIRDEIINGTYQQNQEKLKKATDSLLDIKNKRDNTLQKVFSKKEDKNILPVVNTNAQKEESIKKVAPTLDTKLPIEKNIEKLTLESENNLPSLRENENIIGKDTVKKDILPKVVTDEKLIRNFEPSDGKSAELLPTILAGVNYFGQGAMKGAEGLLDSALQLGTSKLNPYYWLNPDKLESHQQVAKEIIQKDATRDLINSLAGDENFNQNVLDKNSMIKETNIGGGVAKSLGQMSMSLMTGNENIGLGLMGVQSYGGGLEEAYNQGATRSEANRYGLMNAAIETASEKMFGGIGGVLGKGPVDDVIKKKLTKNVSNAITKQLIESGVDIVGEGVEELASDLLQPIAQKLSYASEEDLMKLYQDQNYLEDFVSGALSAGVLQGVTLPSQIKVINNQSQKQIAPLPKLNKDNVNVIKEDVANKQNINYNTNEGDTNGRLSSIIRGNDGGRIGSRVSTQKMEYGANSENVSQRRINRPEFEQFEQQARASTKTNLTSNEQKFTNEIKQQYNKNVAFFDGELSYNAGASITDPNLIFISNNVSETAQKFMTSHEILESNIYHNKLLSNEYIKPTIYDIMNDNSFQEAKESFIKNEDLENASDYAIAKDLLCDIYANKKTGVSLGYENKLSPSIMEEIDYAIDKFDMELSKQNANQSNNNLTVDTLSNNKVNLPDRDYYQSKLNSLLGIDTKGMDLENKKILNQEINRIKKILNIPLDPTNINSYNEINIPTRKDVQYKYMKETDLSNINLDNGKQMSKFMMNRNTAIRLNEKIFGQKVGNQINEKFFYPIKDNESQRIRFLNQERDNIKSLGIKPKSKESEIVQKWGEKKFVNQKGELVPYTEAMLIADVPDINMRNKIKRAAVVLRNKYDNYLEQINTKLQENGYDPIPARDNYFMHFEELTDLFSQIGIPTKINDLPTDINGITDQFKPGKQFFVNAMHRKGVRTTYDAITGIDRYLENASNIMYHTDDIQRLRTFEKYIRDTYGSEKGLSDYEGLTQRELSLVKDDYLKRVEKINSNHLSEYASWLQEYTNLLAGKKAAIDRSIESLFGRKIYKYLQFGKKQVGSNMTGFNIGSALTNIISGTQGMAKTNKKAFIKGTIDTVKNIFKKDDFISKSNFLTTRFGSDNISKTTWEKISNAGQIFMNATDYFTANQIVRGKYYEYIEKGYSQQEAIKYADRFADKLMAGRGKGDMPNVFNSQMLGLLTQFQLEVNNQLDSMFYDTFTENYAQDSHSKISQKSPSTYNTIGATFVLGQIFAFAFLFNNEYEKVVGRRPAFDIIDLIIKSFKDIEDEDKNIYDIGSNLLDTLTDNLPFVSTFTGGGRIPLSSAIPNVENLVTGESSLSKELTKPLTYLLPPTGGGQVKKTIDGLSMFSKNKEIFGSYTDSGNLRFPVEDTLQNRVQATLFGQYANKNARMYFDEEHTPLNEKQQEEYKNLNIPMSDYWSYRSDYKKLNTIKSDLDSNGNAISGSASGKKAYEIMNNDDYSIEEKNYLLNAITTSDNPMTVRELSKISNDETTYKYFYSLTTEQKQKFLDAIDKYNFKGREIANFYNSIDNSSSESKKNSITKHLLSSEMTDQQIAYLYGKYYSSEKALNNILNSEIPMKEFIKFNSQKFETQYDKNGKEIANSRKNAVIKYVNNLKLSTPQKAILIKMEYGSYNTYDKQVIEYVNSKKLDILEKGSILKSVGINSSDKQLINYVNSLSLTIEEKTKILKDMGFTVRNGKVIA